MTVDVEDIIVAATGDNIDDEKCIIYSAATNDLYKQMSEAHQDPGLTTQSKLYMISALVNDFPLFLTVSRAQRRLCKNRLLIES